MTITRNDDYAATLSAACVVRCDVLFHNGINRQAGYGLYSGFG